MPAALLHARLARYGALGASIAFAIWCTLSSVLPTANEARSLKERFRRPVARKDNLIVERSKDALHRQGMVLSSQSALAALPGPSRTHGAQTDRQQVDEEGTRGRSGSPQPVVVLNGASRHREPPAGSCGLAAGPEDGNLIAPMPLPGVPGTTLRVRALEAVRSDFKRWWVQEQVAAALSRGAERRTPPSSDRERGRSGSMVSWSPPHRAILRNGTVAKKAARFEMV